MLRVRRLQIGFLIVALVAASVAIWDLRDGRLLFSAARHSRLIAGSVQALQDRAARGSGGHPAQRFPVRRPPAASWNVIVRWARWIAFALAIASMALAVRYGIFAAGGADAYGYVSQAELFAAGHLSTPDPLASVAAIVGPAAAPLGYQLVANARGGSCRRIPQAFQSPWPPRF